MPNAGLVEAPYILNVPVPFDDVLGGVGSPEEGVGIEWDSETGMFQMPADRPAAWDHLEAFVRFGNGNYARYLWRLPPPDG